MNGFSGGDNLVTSKSSEDRSNEQLKKTCLDHAPLEARNPEKYNRGNILVVSSLNDITGSIKEIVKDVGFIPILADSAAQAVTLFESSMVSYVLVDVNIPDMSSEEFVGAIRHRANERNIPIIILASAYDEKKLSRCADAGCDDFLFSPFNAFSMNTRIASLEQMRDLKYLYKDSIDEQLFAKRILDNALEERSIEFKAIDVLNQSKSVFSGDLFLTARHPDGSLNILLADFTGHGLSAAIGALPVADVFNVMTQKGFTLDYILENINSKLYTLLPTSMFMACSALSISSDLKCVKVWNGGMPDIYIREHGTGHVTHKIESSHIPLGIDEEILNRFKLEVINISIGDQFILYSDGLTDAMDADDNMFGYQNLEQCLLINKEDRSIFSKLVDSFDEFCGDIKPMDDVTLACVLCAPSLMRQEGSDNE